MYGMMPRAKIPIRLIARTDRLFLLPRIIQVVVEIPEYCPDACIINQSVAIVVFLVTTELICAGVDRRISVVAIVSTQFQRVIPITIKIENNISGYRF